MNASSHATIADAMAQLSRFARYLPLAAALQAASRMILVAEEDAADMVFQPAENGCSYRSQQRRVAVASSA